MRAQRAGYQSVVADAAYVYHAEHQTVRKMPEREALFTRNRRWCEEKWGRRIRMVWPRFTPVSPGSEELRQWLTQLRDWARKRTMVYAYCPLRGAMSPEALFRSVGLIPHADVHLRWLPMSLGLARGVALALILQRRKKMFDVVVSPDSRWGRQLQRLRWLHHADVVPVTDETALTLAWKQQSRSRL